MPTECPSCGAARYQLTEVTAMDSPKDRSEWHCGVCGHTWTFPLGKHTGAGLDTSGDDE